MADFKGKMTKTGVGIPMKNIRRSLVMATILFCLGLVPAFSNTDTRNWDMASGKTMHAELVNYDLEKKVALLRQKDGTEIEYPLATFASVDQAWLIEWAEFSDELTQDLQHIEGEFAHYQTEGAFTTDFYVYTPSAYTETTELPMIILLHPSGKGARYVMRFMEAAELLDIIVVSTDGNRNTGPGESATPMFERFKALLVSIEEKIPHDRTRLCLGGTSGGALRALYYSAKIQRPWAGIFSNGGWLGPKNSPGMSLPYPAEMRVAIVNGNNDHAANQFVSRDGKILQERGCEVGLFSFEGGHQVPPPAIQIKVLEWLMRLTDAVYPSPVSLLEND